MAKLMVVEKIHRLTLVRKGRAKAKHPDMQSGVVEVVKATPEQTGTPNLDRFRRGWQ